MLFSLISAGWRFIVEKFEANMFKAITSSPFNFMSIMKGFVDNMTGAGGKDGGKSDSAMQDIFDKMTHPFGDA
jgi:hypothetical protein